MTAEGMEEFLDTCREKGLVEGTVDWYRRGLKHLYQDLPEDKTIRHVMLERWREDLMGQLELEDDPQPKLTRTEYLRLFQTARVLGKEKVYLLIKLFGSTSLTVQELSKVTVEAVEAGRDPIVFSGVKSVVRLPEPLRKEQLAVGWEEG